MATDYEITISKDGTSVDILLNSINGVEHDFDRKVEIIPKPKNDPPLVLNIDLQQLVEIISVTGFLEDESGESALTKKTNLRSIMQSSGTVLVSWGTGARAQSFTGNILKGRIGESSGRLGDEGSQNKIFGVQLQISIGTNKG